ncbi:dipeptide epimerase [Flexithrix dorotheae]|uniref:dipeptide epimerase n=1 Tax=Flexithrix dorotheae TaxID=70993 RepID=UPI000375E289|nr:dipeptide epimerase [Flexithrix dorotheae]
MKLNIYPTKLVLKHPFKIAHDSRESQETVIVELRENSFSGFGEATTNKYYKITAEYISKSLEEVRGFLASYQFETPEKLWEELNQRIGKNSFALCALDEAAYDLYGKIHGKPVYQLWNSNQANNPLTNFTIGIDSIENMTKKLQEQPWPLYKIKLGTSEDIEIIKALRKVTDAVFRVDANCAWTTEETIQNSKEMAELGVEFIEQPLAADNWEGMKKVFQKSALPIIADESCIKENDVEKCYGYFHGVNIKLTKCGGLTPARRMIKKAEELGLKKMVGCMTESTVGISAIAQLLPQLDYVDMDGALLLKSDIASGVTIENGIVKYGKENGSGVTLLKETLNV